MNLDRCKSVIEKLENAKEEVCAGNCDDCLDCSSKGCCESINKALELVYKEKEMRKLYGGW